MNYILKSSSETPYVGSPPSSTLIERIDKVVADSESYEDGEPGPEAGTLGKLKTLIQEAEALLAPLGAPKILTYYGEIDLTWESRQRMLRLIAYPGDKPLQLYVWTKDDSPLPKGTMKPAMVASLSEELTLVLNSPE